MKDDEWYEWDDYCDMLQAIVKKLGPEVTKSIGKKIVMQSKEVFVSQGFDSPDTILKDYNALFAANVRGAPASDPPRTKSFSPGHVVIEAGKVQPKEVIQGYLDGIVKMYGNRVTSLTAEDAGNVWRYELKCS